MLHKDAEMDKWFRGFKGTATLHQCNDILDPTFKPDVNDPDAMELFQVKNHYMFTVFNHVLQTDTGRSLVRKFDTTMDAQSVYRGLLAHRHTSTAATIHSGNSFTYIQYSIY